MKICIEISTNFGNFLQKQFLDNKKTGKIDSGEKKVDSGEKSVDRGKKTVIRRGKSVDHGKKCRLGEKNVERGRQKCRPWEITWEKW